jgi:Holliday junction resolvase RusA-like endonuclease
MTFTIHGPPRTKKTSNRIVRVKGRPVVLPSKANETWARAAVLQMRSEYHRSTVLAVDPAAGKLTLDRPLGPINTPVKVAATFYRDANRGDLIGYMQALADALEAAGVVENDRLIVSWDGTRMLVDRHAPRVEVTVEPAA